MYNNGGKAVRGLRLLKFFAGSLRKRLVLYFTLLMMVPLSAAGYMIYTASDARISEAR